LAQIAPREGEPRLTPSSQNSINNDNKAKVSTYRAFSRRKPAKSRKETRKQLEM
jgi:hypothetical protein